MALVNHMIHTVQAEMLNHYLIVAISLACLPALAQPAYALGQTQAKARLWGYQRRQICLYRIGTTWAVSSLT